MSGTFDAVTNEDESSTESLVGAKCDWSRCVSGELLGGAKIVSVEGRRGESGMLAI